MIGSNWRRERESKSRCGFVSWLIFLLCLGFANAQLELNDLESNVTLGGGKFGWPFGLWSPKHSPHQSLKLKDDYRDVDLANYGDFERHPCRRVCQQGQSQSCYYQLVVHNYRRLGPECQRCQYDERACAGERCIYGDGVPSPIMAVNRQVPGPPIELCENDTMIVDVLNYLGEATTIHWHGIHMSRTPELDGAPFVTQYPVQPGEVYRYEFKVDRSGSLWYHSHVGWQRGLGLAGNLIVRQSRQANLHAQLYDYDLIEHALMVQDILYDYNFQQVRNILINGKGRNHLNQLPDTDNRHRYERLRVTPGYRYRMRVISNGVFNCPVEFSVEGHKLLIISTDGNDIEPVLADGFFLTSSERFDFVLEANQYAKNYWIRVRGFEDCAERNLYQGAVLSYRGAARTELPVGPIAGNSRERRQHTTEEEEEDEPPFFINDCRFAPSNVSNLLQTPAEKDTNVGTVALRSLEPVPWPRYTKFLTYYSSFGFRMAPNGEQLFQIDDISYNPPTISLLQGRQLYKDDTYFCNRSSLAAQGRNCERELCECLNVIRLPAFRPIEMVIVNYMDQTHPLHIHGYTFRLVGQGVLGNLSDLRNVRELDRRGRLPRLSDDFAAVAKDTVQLPAMGYVIVRFITDNPGFWFYHCHIESHAVQGMVAVLKVGEDYQMKRIPARVRC
ncbi:L-ascorbate oxidase [Scaptodrosophila lebanonensis]|uniref:L-ascorbate oxidase n=1 Tax=Drosophila lebanonensis TaxID=7225 RepID=A0A6J2TNW7_DROLE|nr:L-ascorbate oxidase [Scaptodrosophila lebanonensis]